MLRCLSNSQGGTYEQLLPKSALQTGELYGRAQRAGCAGARGAVYKRQLWMGVLFTFLEIITGLGICSLIGMVFLLYFMFRCFSRNIAARARENARYIALTAKPRAAWARFNTRWDQRKTTKFLKCPQCGQSLSVPKGKGTLKITCPKCRNQFTTKS